ncbi:hypothetical protein CI109_105656 [Kwoniella shandongensis]|uniref:Early meiotic induction protein 1 n=1 Tax=Kwoniella shandongensis TaxID=1734106 RepID=A0AAJ8LNM4_9TREE
MHIPFFGSTAEQPAASSSSSSSSTASSSTSSTPTPVEVPTPPPSVNRFESVLHDEEKYQELQYPTFEDVPGCMRLLDEFLMCYALVPQLRNMYRHGEFRDCTWKFQDFKYCLSMKSESPEARRELWVKRRADWWARRRVGGWW